MINRLIVLLFSSITFLTAGLWADEPGFSPKFEAGTLFVMGTAYELVLRDGTYNNPVSRLTWPVQPSLGFETSVELPWTPWTSTLVGLEGTFPLGLGTMVDEDWNATTQSGFLVYGNSQQQSYLDTHYQARLEEGFKWLDFVFSVGGLYRWVAWEGWNGTGTYQYSSPTVRTENDTFSGPIITYRQQWFIPYLAAAWTWKGAGWSVTPSGRLSPYTWCFDSDFHNYAGEATHDYMDSDDGGLYIRLGVESEFTGGKGWSWGIRGACDLAYGAKGDTTDVTTSQTTDGTVPIYTTSPNNAGAWYYEASLTVFVRN